MRTMAQHRVEPRRLCRRFALGAPRRPRTAAGACSSVDSEEIPQELQQPAAATAAGSPRRTRHWLAGAGRCGDRSGIERRAEQNRDCRRRYHCEPARLPHEIPTGVVLWVATLGPRTAVWRLVHRRTLSLIRGHKRLVCPSKLRAAPDRFNCPEGVGGRGGVSRFFCVGRGEPRAPIRSKARRVQRHCIFFADCVLASADEAASAPVRSPPPGSNRRDGA